MDQNSSNGTDKRSWRERLGIGAGKDMPRIADEFSPPAGPPAAARPAAVKPAPMAPRPGVKAAPPRGTAAAAPPVASGEKLAEKLKAQREAQERLAEQRVQAARQRAEIKLPESNGAKPKFTFAVDEAEQKAATAPPKAAAPAVPVQAPARPAFTPPPPPAATPARAAAPSRVSMPPPVMTPSAPITPPRSPLGADRPMMPPRGPAQMPPPVVPTRPQSRFSPPPSSTYGSTVGYGAQTPPYRPIDPSSRGYAGAGYQPPPAYTPPPAGGNYGAQPRLNMPSATPPGAGYGAEGFETRGRSMRPPPRPAVGGYRDEYGEGGDVFAETRATRRATAGDYSQAYRDEQGYDEDLPPSRGPWLPLALLLLLGLLAGGGIWWFYQSNITPSNTAGGQSGNTPVVEAPSQPAKVTPDPAPAQQGQPAKKLIYDRIVGDREVLGGDVIQSEEVPAPPGDSTNLQQGADPAAATGEAAPAQPASGQEELVPLPLPPPPGEGGANDQQGSLPGGTSNNQAMIEPAAGASQAAEPSLTGTAKSDQEGIISAAKSDAVANPAPAASGAPDPLAEAAPVPGETAASGGGTDGTEVISEPDPAPVKKKVAEDKPKKPAAKRPAKTAEKNLGSKPVVLVPPAKGAAAAPEQDVASIDVGGETGNVASGGGGIYDGGAVVDAPAATAPAPAPVKKKRTIADLFRGDDGANDAAEAPAQQQSAAPAKQVQPAPQQKAVQPAPAPQEAPAGGSGYVVQLASFANQSDATKEYGRLKSKHGGALSGLTPIVTQAVVGGSTRYRLAVGVMASREQASAVCSKLFAGGERDCLVRRQ
jgi:cell division septation protein DedD